MAWCKLPFVLGPLREGIGIGRPVSPALLDPLSWRAEWPSQLEELRGKGKEHGDVCEGVLRFFRQAFSLGIDRYTCGLKCCEGREQDCPSSVEFQHSQLPSPPHRSFEEKWKDVVERMPWKWILLNDACADTEGFIPHTLLCLCLCLSLDSHTHTQTHTCAHPEVPNLV